jgi:hypothetical protein
MLEFFCFDPEIAKKMPIVPMSTLKYDWITKAREHYKKHPEHVETTKCPGIMSIMNRGWTQRAYQDIIIETRDNLKSYIGYEKDRQIKKRGGKYMQDYVSGGHPADQMWSFRKEWPKETMHCIVKIQSPWFVKVPEGYSLLFMPVPYAEDVRFTAAPGFIKGNSFLNIQLFWHCTNSKEIIKAGTPLNQMILVKDEKVEMRQSVIEDIDSFMKEEYPEVYKREN